MKAEKKFSWFELSLQVHSVKYTFYISALVSQILLLNPRFTLKQEEEKKRRVETLYEKTKEKLRKKEDQCCKEMEEKQQLELRSRNLEMELITLRKLLKQVY